MSSLSIEACGDCTLAKVLKEAHEENPGVWEFLGGKATNHMMIAARGAGDDPVAQKRAIEIFAGKSETEGKMMAAAIECLHCPNNFVVNGKNITKEVNNG